MNSPGLHNCQLDWTVRESGHFSETGIAQLDLTVGVIANRSRLIGESILYGFRLSMGVVCMARHPVQGEEEPLKYPKDVLSTVI